jgi:hypothetical protein
MRKIACVLIIGIIMFGSPVASALQIVEGPTEGSIWARWGHSGVGVDQWEVTTSSRFQGAGVSLSGGDWTVEDRSASLIRATSSFTVYSMLITTIIAGDFHESSHWLNFTGKLRERVVGSWCFTYRDGSYSVPDAGIMWLLGPALIVLGLIGRKKNRTDWQQV